MATTQARRLVDWVLALVLLAIPAAFLRAHLRDPRGANAVDRVVLRIASPIQSAVSWVIGGVGGLVTGYVWLVDVRKEDAQLRAENERLHRALAETERRAASVPALEQAAQLAARVPTRVLGARVIGTSLSTSFRTTRIVLDRGEGEVREGMAVLGPAGVVGRIDRVVGKIADVRLATDPGSSIPVVVARTGGRGVLKGVGGEDRYTCRIDYLLPSDQAKEGDVIRTSGLGGAFPKDEPVGRVTQVVDAKVGLFQEVRVEPAVDFGRLEHVVVVLTAPPEPDPTATEKKMWPPAFGTRPSR